MGNGWGGMKGKVKEILGKKVGEMEKKEVCRVIYYGEEKLEVVKEVEKEVVEWYVMSVKEVVKVWENV